MRICAIKQPDRKEEQRISTHMSKGTRGKTDLKNYTLPELEAWIVSLGEKPYRARQIMRWIYAGRASSFDAMTDLSRSLQERLAAAAYLSSFTVKTVSRSVDGTDKFLFAMEDGSCIETVLIPEKKHHTICVSTQLGCAMGCAFCLSGTKGLLRNLSVAEIVNQVLHIQKDYLPDEAVINLVFMGMGEPLANYENLLKALQLLTDPAAGNLSHRRITVSTSGLIPQMERLSRALPVNLAISLNAAIDRRRTKLMPVNTSYPLAELIDAAARLPLPARKRITFEYILMKGVNDSIEDARKLAALLRHVPCKINLIPFNEYEGAAFNTPDASTIAQFRECLTARRFTVMLRQSKGKDVSAACGQLGYAHLQSD
jgi:23S rRNA (adenine2503-C2)-methyltransferase